MTEDELRELEPAVVDAQEERLVALDRSNEQEPDGGSEEGDELPPTWAEEED